MFLTYLKATAKYFLLPDDRPSAAVAVMSLLVNGILIVITAPAWKDAAEDVCSADTKLWLVFGVVSDAIHVLFAVYFVWFMRRRAVRLEATVIPANMTPLRLLLASYSVMVYGVFVLWVIVWMALTYRRFPVSGCTRSVDGEPTRDLCCVFNNVLSSVNVFYLAGFMACVSMTLVTEFASEPRWWQTLLLKEVRRREIEAMYEETGHRPTRANSNADTDREMERAGLIRPSSHHSHILRHRDVATHTGLESPQPRRMAPNVVPPEASTFSPLPPRVSPQPREPASDRRVTFADERMMPSEASPSGPRPRDPTKTGLRLPSTTSVGFATSKPAATVTPPLPKLMVRREKGESMLPLQHNALPLQPTAPRAGLYATTSMPDDELDGVDVSDIEV